MNVPNIDQDEKRHSLVLFEKSDRTRFSFRLNRKISSNSNRTIDHRPISIGLWLKNEKIDKTFSSICLDSLESIGCSARPMKNVFCGKTIESKSVKFFVDENVKRRAAADRQKPNASFQLKSNVEIKTHFSLIIDQPVGHRPKNEWKLEVKTLKFLNERQPVLFHDQNESDAGHRHIEFWPQTSPWAALHERLRHDWPNVWKGSENEQKTSKFKTNLYVYLMDRCWRVKVTLNWSLRRSRRCSTLKSIAKIDKSTGLVVELWRYLLRSNDVDVLRWKVY